MSLKSWASILLITCWIAICHNVYGQNTDKDTFVSLFDLRQETPERAVISALHASKSNAIIVMARGADQTLIDQTEADLSVLVRSGHNRLVFVLSQPFEDDPVPLICIYAEGKPYILLKNVQADARTSADLYRHVKEAYNQFIREK